VNRTVKVALRGSLATTAVVCSLLCEHSAQAAEGADVLGRIGPRGSRRTESPQDAAVELRFQRYVPDQIDDGLSGAPYKEIFGDNNRYLFGLEFDWQVLRIPYLGTLAPGLGIGFSSISAKAPLANGEGRSEGQKTSLRVLPTYLVAVLRADVVARETVVPLVPYAKVGLGATFWQIMDGSKIARSNGVVGTGTSYGPQFALGAMLLLDWFSPQDALSADAALGLNNSYVFGEWFVSKLDGFGSKDTLNLSLNTWTFGLALEF